MSELTNAAKVTSSPVTGSLDTGTSTGPVKSHSRAASIPSSDVPGERVHCPFVRHVVREGGFQVKVVNEGDITRYLIPREEFIKKSVEFGISEDSSRKVATDINSKQGLSAKYEGWFDIGGLARAPGASHFGGFALTTKNLNTIDTERLAGTLNILESRKDSQGKVAYEDLVDVSFKHCKDDGVDASMAALIETMLPFILLGGPENQGKVSYQALEELFRANGNKIPANHGTITSNGVIWNLVANRSAIQASAKSNDVAIPSPIAVAFKVVDGISFIATPITFTVGVIKNWFSSK